MGLAVALVATATAAVGCARDSGAIELSGRVVDETVVLSAPLHAPAAVSRTTTATGASVAGVGAVSRVASVGVSVGDRVAEDEIVAELDTSALDAGVSQARAAHRVALARVEVLSARLDDVADARSTLASKQSDLRDTLAELTDTRADLAAQLSTARARLAELKAASDKLNAAPRGAVPTATPPGKAPGGADPNAIAAAIAELEAGIVRMEAGLAKMDAGLEKARDGRAKLDSASATLADTREMLRGMRTIARAASEVTEVAVDLARARRELAVVSSPVGGTVVRVVSAGESVAPASPVATIRPLSVAVVETYVTPEQRTLVAIGDAASITADSLPGRTYAGRVTAIDERAAYPPTWFATTETHLTRAYKVRITLDDEQTATPPPGTPADIRLVPSRTS